VLLASDDIDADMNGVVGPEILKQGGTIVSGCVGQTIRDLDVHAEAFQELVAATFAPKNFASLDEGIAAMEEFLSTPTTDQYSEIEVRRFVGLLQKLQRFLADSDSENTGAKNFPQIDKDSLNKFERDPEKVGKWFEDFLPREKTELKDRAIKYLQVQYVVDDYP
jgi:hypothetical protein